jgi:hypothetical protein
VSPPPDAVLAAGPPASVTRVQSGAAGGRQKSRKTPSLGHLAVGTQRGAVVVWNLGRGEVAAVLGEVRGCVPLTLRWCQPPP